MRIHWHALSFAHTCGLQGVILQVCVSADGCLAICGVCAVCGVEFKSEETWAGTMISATIEDYKKSFEVSEVNIADMEVKGMPS